MRKPAKRGYAPSKPIGWAHYSYVMRAGQEFAEAGTLIRRSPSINDFQWRNISLRIARVQNLKQYLRTDAPHARIRSSSFPMDRSQSKASQSEKTKDVSSLILPPSYL